MCLKKEVNLAFLVNSSLLFIPIALGTIDVDTMKLSLDAIEELKKIYHEEYGRPLSDADAQEMGQRLLRLFKIIYRPIPSGELSCKCHPVDRFPATDKMK